jgi:hypothetical protein
MRGKSSGIRKQDPDGQMAAQIGSRELESSQADGGRRKGLVIYFRLLLPVPKSTRD